MVVNSKEKGNCNNSCHKCRKKSYKSVDRLHVSPSSEPNCMLSVQLFAEICLRQKALEWPE